MRNLFKLRKSISTQDGLSLSGNSHTGIRYVIFDIPIAESDDLRWKIGNCNLYWAESGFSGIWISRKTRQFLKYEIGLIPQSSGHNKKSEKYSSCFCPRELNGMLFRMPQVIGF